MLDLFAFDETHRLAQHEIDKRNLLRATWREREPRLTTCGASDSVRRRLALALLGLADRLDPRTVVSAPHLPAAPTMNGTLHHA